MLHIGQTYDAGKKAFTYAKEQIDHNFDYYDLKGPEKTNYFIQTDYPIWIKNNHTKRQKIF